MKIVEKIIQNNRIAINEVVKEFGVSRQMALKEMNKLVNLSVIRLRGKGRGAYYELV